MAALQTMKALANAGGGGAEGLNEETMADLRELMATRESTQAVLEEHARETRGSSDGGRGIQFFGLLSKLSDGTLCNNVNSPNTKKFEVRFEVIDLPEAVNPTFGVVEPDNVHEDSELAGVPVFTVRGREFDVANEATGAHVLKVKIRARTNPETGENWPDKYPLKKRPVTRVIYVWPGDEIKGNMFQVQEPKDPDGRDIQLGAVVVVRGVQAREFTGEDGSTHAAWNVGALIVSPVNVEDVHSKKFAHKDIEVPRNSYVFVRVTEAPNDRDTDFKEMRRFSPELSELKNARVQFASWETNLSDQARAAHEMTKKSNLFWNRPIFTRDQDDYGGTVEAKDGKPERHYSRIMFLQMSMKRDVTNPDEPVKERVLHDVSIGERQVRQFFGMADQRKFKRVASVHVPKMRFVITAMLDHKRTFGSDMNDASTRGEDFKDIDYKLVWRTTPTSFAHTNLRAYIAKNGYPVTYDFVKELVGKNSTALKSSFHDANFYNTLPAPNFVNLSEFNGNLESFPADQWEFRVIDDREPDEDKLERVASIEDAKERAEACSASLLGKSGETLRLGKCKDHDPVVFALSKKLLADMAANPSAYDFSSYMEQIEKKHAEYDPTSAVTEAKERKRRREEQGDAAIGVAPQSSSSSPPKRARTDNDNDDDDEESMT